MHGCTHNIETHAYHERGRAQLNRHRMENGIEATKREIADTQSCAVITRYREILEFLHSHIIQLETYREGTKLHPPTIDARPQLTMDRHSITYNHILVDGHGAYGVGLHGLAGWLHGKPQ